MGFDDKGPWSVEANPSDDKQKIIIQSDDFNHDVWFYLSGENAPSVHPWKARFEAKYGKQEILMKMCNEILINNPLARLS